MAAYRFSGYWKDVGTLESLWDANMDMLSPESGLDLLDESWPIYARSVNAPPGFLEPPLPDQPQCLQPGQRSGGDGGELRPGSQCHRGGGARVSYSVLFPGVTVEPGAVVEYAILGEGCRIGRNCRLGGTPEETAPDPWGLTVLAPGCVLEDEKRVRPGVMLNKNGEEVSR